MSQSPQTTANVTPASAAPCLDLPAYGASLFLTLLHLILAVFSVAFRRDVAVPVPEAPRSPDSVPDLATLHSQKTTIYDSIFFSTPSISSTLSIRSTGSTASTQSALSARLNAIFRPTGLMPFRALLSPSLSPSPSPSQSPSSSIRNPQSAILNLPVSSIPHSAFHIPHCFHPPPPS